MARVPGGVMSEAASRGERRVEREAEWRSRLARASAASLLFLTASGLVIWWSPFAILPQMAVLSHTLLGLVLGVPVAVYAVRHWLLYRRHLFSAIKLLGYLAVWLLIV